MNDERALLAAIQAHPGEDTPRLALADWYAEHDRREDACNQRLAVQFRAVKAAPDDDTPRLAYAQVCEDHGQTERANFIRAQLHLARKDRDTALDAPYRECESEFLQAERDANPQYPQLLGDDPSGRLLAQHGTNLCFDRGFLDAVAMPLSMWLQHGDDILAHHPVADVTVDTAFGAQRVDNEVWIDGDPHGRRFTLAQIEGERRVGDPEELLAGPYLVPLVHLRWPRVAFTAGFYIPSGVGSPTLHELRYLLQSRQAQNAAMHRHREAETEYMRIHEEHRRRAMTAMSTLAR